MLTRRSFVGSSVLAVGAMLLPIAAAEAAVNPADFRLGLGWSRRWKRFPGNSGESWVEKTATGLRMFGPQTIVSKKTVTKLPGQRLRIVCVITDLNGRYGTEQESGILYTFMRGAGTASRPVNVAQWATNMIGQPSLFEGQPGCSCNATTFAPRGTPIDWDWRIRLRQWKANGTQPRVVENSDNPPHPAPFEFPMGVAYECTQTIVGQTFKWKQTRLSDGETREMSVVDPRFDDLLSGNIGWRPMTPLAFEVRDLNVTVT